MRITPIVLGVALAATAEAALAQQIVPLGDRDVPLEGRAQDVFRVGENEVREEEQFARIAATAFDDADNLYVLDSQNNRITVFDANGKFVRSIGRKGQGPGELGFPLGLAVTNDRHLVVMDLGNRAFVVYGPDGTYIRNIPLDRELGIGGRFMMPHPKGGVVFALNPGLSVRNGAPQMDTTGIKVYWLQSLAEGATPTLLTRVPEPKMETKVEGSPGSGRVMVMRQAPPAFTPQLNLALTADGSLVINNTADYHLDVLGANGQVARRMRRPYSPRKVTEADKDAERKRRAELLASGGGTRVMVGGGGGGVRTEQVTREALDRAREGLRNLEFAETVPVVLSLYTDPAGRIWVLRSGAAPGRPPVIDIVGVGGRYLGTVQGEPLPSSVSRSGLAAYIGTSELDVPIVTVRRLPQNRRG